VAQYRCPEVAGSAGVWFGGHDFACHGFSASGSTTGALFALSDLRGRFCAVVTLAGVYGAAGEVWTHGAGLEASGPNVRVIWGAKRGPLTS
jgi:hypothetical protein